MNFGDLAFFPHGNYPDSGIAARHFYPNGYGVSVVQFTSPYGSGSYGADEGLYELAVLQGLEEDWEICYDTPITDDVMGYLTVEDVETIINQVKELK
jgi:hypothetical protein